MLLELRRSSALFLSFDFLRHCMFYTSIKFYIFVSLSSLIVFVIHYNSIHNSLTVQAPMSTDNLDYSYTGSSIHDILAVQVSTSTDDLGYFCSGSRGYQPFFLRV